MKLGPAQAKAGSEVTVTGTGFSNRDPVSVRFNALDGPVLGTFTVTGGNFSAPVTVPAGTAAGNYVLIGVQTYPDGKVSGVPTRALLEVVGAGGSPTLAAPAVPVEAGRPASLVEADSVSSASVALVGLGVAGVAMFLAGIAALFAGRRRVAEPSRVTRQQS
ncbi:MAG: hypothetical protein ACRD0F_07300 [Acidimicrobiales bacterium]